MENPDDCIPENQSWEIYDEYRPFWIAGTYYCKENVERFIRGRFRSLEVRHEPLEKYPHALAIYGVWVETDEQDCDDFREEKLGYIPDWLAEKIYRIINNLEQSGQETHIVPSIHKINKESNSIQIGLDMRFKDKLPQDDKSED